MLLIVHARKLITLHNLNNKYVKLEFINLMMKNKID